MSDYWGNGTSRAAWAKRASTAKADELWGQDTAGDWPDDGTWARNATKDDSARGKVTSAGWDRKATKDDSAWGNDGTSTRDDENVQPRASQGDWGDRVDRAPAAEGLKEDFTCRVCGEQGHFARNCPQQDGPMTCYNCGEAGHTKAECSQPTKSRGCFNCGEEGHSKAECTQPPKTRPCFNCGEEGHTKVECTNPRVFQGTCRLCNKEGHPAAECPERPPDICKNCKGEGHKTKDCKANRKFDLDHVADKLPEEAWDMMRKASNEKDLDDFREAFAVYSKAVPLATFAEIETKMRADNFKIFLIALEKAVGDVMSVIDLQGQLDRHVEDNIERLGNAGLPYDRKVPKCNNCGEFGHISRSCPQERIAVEQVEIKCVNCNELGHRVRDCKEPRRNKFACRNCGSVDHLAAECPEPPSADNVECRKCHQTGHFAKDCPEDSGPRTCRKCGSEDHLARDCDQPQDISTVICRNCDQPGHFARECTEKKNWAKVKCNNCGEMGHTVRRCPQANAGTKTGDLIDTGYDWQTGNAKDDWNTGKDDQNASSKAVDEGNYQDYDHGGQSW